MSAVAAEARVHLLHPGDVALAEAGERLETLLGSCVAIVLTDPRRSVGAMCHIVHAGERQGGGTAFAGPALAALFALLRGRAIEPARCTAFVYGGGDMFPALARPRRVGTANAAWAFEALERHGIGVAGHDVGGACYRRLSWTVGPGAPRVEAGAAREGGR